MGSNYWMVVQSKENFAVSSKLDFKVHGLRRTHRRRAERMSPNDRVLYYISTLRKWGATATITSSYFEDHSPIWTPIPRGEVYPYRVNTAPNMVLDEEDFIDALELAPRLEYVKRWAPEDWPMAFVDSLHLIPQRDFRLIEGEMRRLISNKRRRRHGHPRGEEDKQQGGSGDGLRGDEGPSPTEAQPAEDDSTAPASR